MHTEIKFCGLTRPEDAAFAASLGARYVGVIFAESPRRVTGTQALEIFASLATVDPAPRRVGVLGRGTQADITAFAGDAELDVVQLHADPTPVDVRALRDAFDGEIWAVRRIAADRLPDDMAVLAGLADRIVLDARAQNGGPLGGTGQRFDWERVADQLAQMAVPRLVLAGGLTPENVGLAIELFAPSVVDVSSGVESSPGVKDHSRMRDFAKAVEAARR